MFKRASFLLPNEGSLRTQFSFPNVLANALLVYRILPKRSDGSSTCAGADDKDFCAANGVECLA